MYHWLEARNVWCKHLVADVQEQVDGAPHCVVIRAITRHLLESLLKRRENVLSNATEPNNNPEIFEQRPA
jgi:hypothetical protein